jgi:carboxymethylenebutenolidase
VHADAGPSALDAAAGTRYPWVMPAIELHAADGHTLHAFRIDPQGTPRGGVVVVQEIFGVNAHIRAVTVRFAAMGYRAIAPALFDRVERGVELGYDEEGFSRGRALVGQLTPEGMLADLQAAIAAVSAAGKVGMVGYCFGGSVAWVAAARLPDLAGPAELACAVSYYGSRILQYRELAPRVPVQMHVGRKDASFPVEQVREIATAHAGVELYEYDAGHGFDCDHRKDFDADAAAAALEHTLEFFARHVG